MFVGIFFSCHLFINHVSSITLQVHCIKHNTVIHSYILHHETDWKIHTKSCMLAFVLIIKFIVCEYLKES